MAIGVLTAVTQIHACHISRGSKIKKNQFIKKMPEIQPLVVILPFDGIPSYKHRYEMQSSSAS